MRNREALGIFCVTIFATSCKVSNNNLGDVKAFAANEAKICDKFVTDAQRKEGKEFFECKSKDNQVQICIQLDKGLMGTTYKVNYSTSRKTASGSSYSGETFSVPNLIPLDNLKTWTEAPDPKSLIVFARRTNSNGNGEFGYLAETRLEFKNSFETARIMRFNYKEKNPTPKTPRDTVFDLEANFCSKIMLSNEVPSQLKK